MKLHDSMQGQNCANILNFLPCEMIQHFFLLTFLRIFVLLDVRLLMLQCRVLFVKIFKHDMLVLLNGTPPKLT